MDKHSIPINYYLNDGQVDKTGYQQLTIKSIMKAANCYPTVHGVSIGPDAVEKAEWDLFTPKFSDTQKPILNVESVPKTSPKVAFTDVSLNKQEPYEKREEMLCRKKILAEIENIYYLESQEKIDKMKKEWLQREEMLNARIKAELEAERIIREQIRLREINAIQAKIMVDRANSAYLKKLTEDEEVIKSKELQLQNEMKILETNRMLKELNKIYDNEVEFREKCGEIVKIITEFTESKFQNSIVAEKDVMKASNNEFLEVIDSCKANSVSPEVVAKSYSLVSSIKKVHDSIITKYEYYKKEIENEKKSQEEAELKKKEEELRRNMSESKSKLEESEKENTEVNEEDRLMSTWSHYMKYEKPLIALKKSLKTFIEDTSLKKFRSECQKAVNVPVNAISPTSAAHMNDKLKKLISILSGQQIMVNSKLFNPNQHPLGVQYCTYFLAKKIVKQGEDVVSSQPDAAFAIAAVALAIWGDFPNFGSLLIATFYEDCPYLIPIYWKQEENQSEKEYYKMLGFRYVEDERDDINTFLKKQGGIARLYFALMVTYMKSTSKHQHPLGICEAWRWIAMFTSLGPQAEISATILLIMLEICGFALMKAYGKQFKKLLHLICVHYLPEVEKVTPPGSGGPVTRLKSFLENMIGNASSLQPPKGLLQPNFW